MYRGAAILMVALASLAVWGVPATDVALVFEEDRTEANRTYRDKETTVSGNVTHVRRQGGSEYRIVLDDAVAIVLDKREPHGATAIEALLEAQAKEDERLDDAREWAHDYKRKFRRYGGRYRGREMDSYDDEMNPKGSTENELNVEFHATGTCQGVRGGHVLIDPVTQVAMTATKVTKKAAVAKAAKKEDDPAQAAAMEKTSWKLDGKVYCEHGKRYFAPSPDQFGVDVWSITLPAKLGDVAIVPAVNGKDGTLEFDCKPAKRGKRGIAAHHVKLKIPDAQVETSE